MKHTPKPWEIGRKSKMSTTVDNCCVATVFPKGNSKDHKTNIRITMHGVEDCNEAEANAYLIAAAPELLGACKKVYKSLTDRGEVNLILKQAIAKAEGI